VSVSHALDAKVATVELIGDVDIGGDAALHQAVGEIAKAEPAMVCVDLSATTFAGSALLNFLIQVRNTVGAKTPLVVRRPSPLTRRMIELTDIDSILTFGERDSAEGSQATADS
jgi:anti-anti-sigma factor